MKTPSFTDIAIKLSNHAALISAKVPPNQALSICFGDKFANEAIKVARDAELILNEEFREATT